jgi:hypothetical protein
VEEDITSHDGRKRRCPMLGHDVQFSYCRAPGRRLPCRRVFDCWFETFDVEAFIRGHFAEADIQQILAPPTDKVSTLLDLIEKARRSGGGSSEQPP